VATNRDPAGVGPNRRNNRSDERLLTIGSVLDSPHHDHSSETVEAKFWMRSPERRSCSAKTLNEEAKPSDTRIIYSRQMLEL